MMGNRSGRGAMTGISRREVLLGGSALLLLAGCGGPSIPRPTASPSGAIRAQLDEVITTIAAGSDKLGVALHDLRTDETYGFNPGYASQSASIAKLMIVLMAQRRALATGADLTGEQQEQITRAITRSDNDAADALWAYAGAAPAYAELAGELGLADTHPDEKRSESWSWTWTTPADQALLVQALTEGSPAIADRDRLRLWELMGQVVDDQAWGVGAPRSSEVAVHLKNGWVQFQSSDGLWAVNSVGQVTGAGRDYRLAIMTRTPDFDTGRAICDEIGKWVFDILGSGPVEPG